MSINLFENKHESFDSQINFEQEVKQIIEGLLFASHEPLSLKKMKEIISSSYVVKEQLLLKLIEEIRADWKREKRGFQVDEIAHGYLLRTDESVLPFVELLHRERKNEKLSKAAMEVLAIVAYKQPITRAMIENIRGVDSSGTLYSLVERGLIEVVGKLDAPGRPSQYGVTLKFLKHFGLNSIEDLPKVFPI